MTCATRKRTAPISRAVIGVAAAPLVHRLKAASPEYRPSVAKSRP